jgi:hypothetical protein
MEEKIWNRRQVIERSARVAAGVALAELTFRRKAAAQLPPPEPLNSAPSTDYVRWLRHLFRHQL